MKILIGEDDMTSRIILDSILKKWGFIPVLACDGKEAWNIMQSDDAPKLVILDWQMPEMNGIEVCQMIRKVETTDPPHVIILTSKDEKKDIVTALDAGANDFISKPYNNEELRARINVGKRMVELQAALGKAFRALEHEAMHDPLTNIYNRRAILKLMEKEMARARREKSHLCIAICDLDKFKLVNDIYGHRAGDEVLIAFTRLTQEKLRENDHLGRYGGEEFLIVAPGSTGIEKQTMFERVCDYIRNTHINTEAGDISISVSIGVARYTGVESGDLLLAAADIALYHAKETGRDRVIYAADIKNKS